jgi:hypothetical protein
MIPRVTVPFVLLALAAGLVVGAAAEGGLDAWPPQPYFPADLRRAVPAPCPSDAPLRAARSEPVVDAFRADWFGRQLRAAHELSLSQPPDRRRAPRTSLRFLWLRTWHAPVVVRVDERAPGDLWLTAKQLSGTGGYGPGKINRTLVRALTPDEASGFRRAYKSVAGLAPLECGGGADGAEWVLETREAGRYRLVRRWSPTAGPVREVGTVLLGFTGWNTAPVY